MFSHLFHEGPYRFQMRFEKGSIAAFYGATAEHEGLLRERRHWLERARSECVVALPEAFPLLLEMAAELQMQAAPTHSPDMLCASLGERLEPDFLLLRHGAPGTGPRLVAACVCFPSSWDVREKIGLPVSEIHGVVPDLNASIGPQIETFLARLRPGTSWERSNWGLSRSPELNQHPARRWPRLDSAVTLDEIFFRVEYQSLAALPRTGGVLFGIRIRVFPLGAVKADEQLRTRLVEALRTMPEKMATYKNIAGARSRILELLNE